MMKRTTLSVLAVIAATQAQAPANTALGTSAATAAGATVEAPAPAPVVTTTPAPAPVAKAASEAPALEKPNAITIHPLMTGITLGISGIPTWWYFTYERELGNGKSITLQPLFTTGEFDPEFFDGNEYENPIEVSQFGLMGSYRIYTNGEESRGHYFAPAVMFSKLSVSQDGMTYSTWSGSYEEADAEITGTTFAALVYTGYRGKGETFSWYIDAGIGFQSVSLDVEGDGLEDIEDLSSTGLAIDVNYGVGIAF